ncbi:endonuclease/exonuclease/phosphatase family protein [Demequina silvatica]|uniref:endonuclease/exonuclease/phosphatase family protein n=1 Tax=Demequina silvatica TaxID=1638988 RepID=UPI0007867089|nr:endonuclease/exonuclease/phosphatase family protein [Demequina silvatica]
MGEQGVDTREGSGPSALSSLGRGLTAIARVLAFLALLAVLVPVTARLTGIEAGPLAVLVSLMPWVTLAVAVPLTLALLARAWVLLGVSVAVAALCLWWIAPVYVATSADGDVALRVATFSLANGQADAEAVVELARESDLDVLVLTELTPHALERLEEAGLAEVMPYSAAYPGDWKFGTGLWSTRPITEAESLPGFTAQAIRAQVGTGDARLTVVAAHPESPGVIDHADWDADLAALVDVLAAQEGPVVVAGDLNTTRDHAGFRGIEALGYADASDQAGMGVNATYPNGPMGLHHGPPMWLSQPLVAIDHVLARDTGMVAAEVVTVAMPWSDHRALVATYRWP